MAVMDFFRAKKETKIHNFNAPRYDANVYKSLLSGFGGEKDFGATLQIDANIDLSVTEFTALYAKSKLARKIVEAIPKMALRRGYEIRVNGSEKNIIVDELKRIDFKSKLLNAFIWSRLYGGSLIFIGLKNDESKLSDPLPESKEIEFLHVLTRLEVAAGEVEKSSSSKNYGNPAHYKINLMDDDIEVHSSRFIILKGASLPPDLMAENEGWGDSVLRGVDSLGRLEVSFSAISHLIQRWNQVVWKMEDIGKYIDKGKEKSVYKKVELMQRVLSTLGVILLEKDTEEWDQHQMNVAGLNELVSKLQSAVATDADIPEVVLFGKPPSGMTSDDAASKRNYENVVLDEQDMKLTPAYHQIAEIISGYKKVNNYTISPRHIHSETDAERNIKLKEKSTAALNLINSQVLDPVEIRNSWFKEGNEFSIEIDDSVKTFENILQDPIAKKLQDPVSKKEK